MKRLLPLLLTILLCTGCAAPAGVAQDGRHKVVATIWPEYQWLQAILGENPGNVELTLLVDSGVDPHSFQPSVADLVDLYTCDLLVYIGGDSDTWVADALSGEVDPNLVAIPLMEEISDPLCPGDHDHDHAEEEHHHGYDEHIYLSLRRAQALCMRLAQALGDLDPTNAPLYEANAKTYCDALSDLDAQYAAAVEAAANRTVIFPDRYPFIYLFEDYGLHAHSAFPGCSAETEASFSTITRLSEAVVAEGVPALAILDGSTVDIAQTVMDTAGVSLPVLTLHSMQSRLEGEDTYLSVMEGNLAVLRQLLGST